MNMKPPRNTGKQNKMGGRKNKTPPCESAMDDIESAIRELTTHIQQTHPATLVEFEKAITATIEYLQLLTNKPTVSRHLHEIYTYVRQQTTPRNHKQTMANHLKEMEEIHKRYGKIADKIERTMTTDWGYPYKETCRQVYLERGRRYGTRMNDEWLKVQERLNHQAREEERDALVTKYWEVLE